MTQIWQRGVLLVAVALIVGALVVLIGCGTTSGAKSANKLLYRNGFEADASDFAGRGGNEVLTRTKEAAQGGEYSLKVEGRQQAWNAPSLQVDSYVREGREYHISVWVKLISPDSAQMRLSTQIGNGDGASYNTIDGKTISTGDDWVLFEGDYLYASTGGGFVSLYVETATDATASYYIDNFRLELLGAVPLVIEDIKPLKDNYKGEFLLGSAISGSDMGTIYFDLLTKHFDIATTGNEMKPSSLQHDEGTFTFDTADRMVDAVLAAGLKMHGHVLCWHEQTGDWMYRPGLGRDKTLKNLITHAKTVAEHFKGRVISWDVVNEAMADNPPNPDNWRASLRQTPWLKEIGDDYLELVFKAAREADPDAKLYYNDYNMDNHNKALAVYNMVKEINTKNPNVGGRPLIDGVGMQGHYRVTTSPQAVEDSLAMFISLGVEVSITELDVQAGGPALTEKQANDQGHLYAALFSLFRKYSDNITRVTLWGLDDKSSWRSTTSPLLFDRYMRAKPAFYAASDPVAFVAEHPRTIVETRQAIAIYGTPTIDGTAEALWDEAEEIPIDRALLAWQGASGTAKAMWDDQNLYVLYRVQNAELNKANANAYEQDSIEVFIDENNAKTPFYEGGDGQYRVNFDNEVTFNPENGISAGFVSATKTAAKSYTVEVKIPFKTVTPAADMLIGFDVQINGASSGGARNSVMTWNDTTGEGYQSMEGLGVLKLTR
jgi:endo-1,4-beta-xylanase